MCSIASGSCYSNTCDRSAACQPSELEALQARPGKSSVRSGASAVCPADSVASFALKGWLQMASTWHVQIVDLIWLNGWPALPLNRCPLLPASSWNAEPPLSFYHPFSPLSFPCWLSCPSPETCDMWGQVGRLTLDGNGNPKITQSKRYQIVTDFILQKSYHPNQRSSPAFPANTPTPILAVPSIGTNMVICRLAPALHLLCQLGVT